MNNKKQEKYSWGQLIILTIIVGFILTHSLWNIEWMFFTVKWFYNIFGTIAFFILLVAMFIFPSTTKKKVNRLKSSNDSEDKKELITYVNSFMYYVEREFSLKNILYLFINLFVVWYMYINSAFYASIILCCIIIVGKVFMFEIRYFLRNLNLDDINK